MLRHGLMNFYILPQPSQPFWLWRCKLALFGDLWSTHSHLSFLPVYWSLLSLLGLCEKWKPIWHKGAVCSHLGLTNPKHTNDSHRIPFGHQYNPLERGSMLWWKDNKINSYESVVLSESARERGRERERVCVKGSTFRHRILQQAGGILRFAISFDRGETFNVQYHTSYNGADSQRRCWRRPSFEYEQEKFHG